MPAVDLDADLIPGTSAAGWRLGVRLTECGELLRGATEVEYQPGFNLVEAIHRNIGVLVVRNYFPIGSGNTAIFFGADIVRFDFNAVGALFCVWTFEGYRGRAFGRIGIGSTIQEVQSSFPVFYDDGDEMYYPDQEKSPGVPSGIAFVAYPDDAVKETPVVGICVHDWDVMRNQS
jgi:hypothetical protein